MARVSRTTCCSRILRWKRGTLPPHAIVLQSIEHVYILSHDFRISLFYLIAHSFKNNVRVNLHFYPCRIKLIIFTCVAPTQPTICLSRNFLSLARCPIHGCSEVNVESCGTVKYCFDPIYGIEEVDDHAICPNGFSQDISDDDFEGDVREPVYPIGNRPCSLHTAIKVAIFRERRDIEDHAESQAMMEDAIKDDMQEDKSMLGNGSFVRCRGFRPQWNPQEKPSTLSRVD